MTLTSGAMHPREAMWTREEMDPNLFDGLEDKTIFQFLSCEHSCAWAMHDKGLQCAGKFSPSMVIVEGETLKKWNVVVTV